MVSPKGEQQLASRYSNGGPADERVIATPCKVRGAGEGQKDERPKDQDRQHVVADPAEPRRELRAEPHRHLACPFVGGGDEDVPKGLPHARIPVRHPRDEKLPGRAGSQRRARLGAVDESHAHVCGRTHVVLIATNGDTRHRERFGADVCNRNLPHPAALTGNEDEGTASSVRQGEKQPAPPLGSRLGENDCGEQPDYDSQRSGDERAKSARGHVHFAQRTGQAACAIAAVARTARRVHATRPRGCPMTASAA
jgi:hypothetical protein